MLRQHLITITVATALLAPAAAASWSINGAFEPDTSFDATGGFMFADPDTNPDPGVMKVYFNAFATNLWTNINPNVAATESRILTPGFQGPVAFLGVWKDCNADGYIGHIESAVLQYRSELLSDTTICPDGSAHNSDSWVYEFRWIADGANMFGGRTHVPRFINDTETRVWGDPGLPTDAAVIGCFVNPLKGSFSSTGAILGWSDCNGRRGVTDTYNQVLLGGTTEVAGESVATPGADPSNSLGLAFTNREYPQCSGSKLDIDLNLFDDDPNCPTGKTGKLQQNSHDEAFTVWDCGSVQHVPVVSTPSPTNPDQTITVEFFVPSVSTSPTVNPEGSFYDGANHTVRGVEDGSCDSHDDGQTRLGANYETMNPEEEVPAAIAQRDATFVFDFRHNRVPSLAGKAIAGVTGADTPEAFGVRSYPPFLTGPVYGANIAQTNYPPTINDDLSPEGGVFYTYYAYIGAMSFAAGVQVPSSTVGTYGSERCEFIGAGAPIVGGFDCDPNNWYPEEAPEPKTTYGRPIGARPGQAYQLRDIDCYDGTVTSALPGVGLGLTWLGGEGPCSVN